jgi:tetratricopeptide (TPR) repeat protein
VADYTKAIELNPNDSAAYNNRGVLNYELKKYKEAVDDCSRAIELKPTDAKAYYNRGNAKKKLKLCKEA